jgi:hypothetical protein
MRIPEFIESFYTRTFGSKEEWLKARKANREIDAKMVRKDDRESWVCKKCGQMIVANVNGNRAKVKAGKNTKLFIKFEEMVAYCENCGEFNSLMFDWALDGFIENDATRDTFFVEDRERMLKAKQSDVPESISADDYMLKLK